MGQTIEAKYLPQGAKMFPQGRYTDVMPVLLKEGLVPISPAQVMKARIKAAESKDSQAIDATWMTWVDTGFGLAGTRDKVYLDPNSKILLGVNSNTKLMDYGVPFTPGKDVQAYGRADMILDQDLTEEQAAVHKGWLALAEGDKELLGKYSQHTFRLGKDRFNYDKSMRFYVPSAEEPILRAVVLFRLDARSRAGGDRDLGDGLARLVGVRQSGAPKTKVPLEQRVAA